MNSEKIKPEETEESDFDDFTELGEVTALEENKENVTVSKAHKEQESSAKTEDKLLSRESKKRIEGKSKESEKVSQDYKVKMYLTGVAAVVTAIVIGFFIPKSNNATAHGLEILKSFDKAYSMAKSQYDDQVKRTGELRQEINDKQQELEKSQGADNPNGIIEENLENLRAEVEGLRAQVKGKQDTLDTINAQINEYSNKILTWTSGTYTVGKDIAAGNYNITGSGSVAIGNNNKSKVSKVLKSDGEVFTLSDGDIIKIDGSAKLTPQ